MKASIRLLLLSITIAALIFALPGNVNAGEGMVELYGDVYQSIGNSTGGHSDIWVGIYIDTNNDGEYRVEEMYDTNNTNFKPSTVQWENGTYSLLLQDGDDGWQRGDNYVIVVNGSSWEDQGGVHTDEYAPVRNRTHEKDSVSEEYQIPSSPAVTEENIDIQTRFVGFVINEVVFDNDGTDDDEWIEIHNPTSYPKNMDYWNLNNNDSTSYDLEDIPNVPAGAYVVVHWSLGVSDTNFGDSQANALHIYTQTEDAWGNNEDQVSLYDDWDKIVDHVAYVTDGFYDSSEDDWDAVQAGIWNSDSYVDATQLTPDDSIGLKPNAADSNSPLDWTIYTGPSQGETNDNGTEIPEFPFIPALLGTFLLIFVIRRRRTLGH